MTATLNLRRGEPGRGASMFNPTPRGTRAFSIVSVLLVVLASSCVKSGVPLQSGGTLSASEQQSIIAIHQGFSRWSPSHSALCVRDGMVRHFCLQSCGFGSLTEGYEVFVFDGDGRVVEANFIEAPNPATPKRVSSISPLGVAFERLDGKTMVVGVSYSQDVARERIQKRMNLLQRLE